LCEPHMHDQSHVLVCTFFLARYHSFIVYPFSLDIVFFLRFILGYSCKCLIVYLIAHCPLISPISLKLLSRPLSRHRHTHVNTKHARLQGLARQTASSPNHSHFQKLCRHSGLRTTQPSEGQRTRRSGN
jgi:hypothetical protein